MFTLSPSPLNRDTLLTSLSDNGAGAVVVFEGWVRNHNEGKQVSSLEYQVYSELAMKEGQKILLEAMEKFNLKAARAGHRFGHLQLGEVAIWIGATAAHRDDAFKATRFIIDEIKHRLPVWKKEHYVHEKPEWVFCKHHHHHVHFEEAEYYKKQSSLVLQSKLKVSRVLVVGAGGLGCPALVGLTQAGVGTIGILDFDRIHISNIHRQSLYSSNLVGEKKVHVARNRLQELNPFIQLEAIDARVDSENVLKLLMGYDLILDCTDNMQTKYLLMDACFQIRLPLISASVFKQEGQIRTFIPGSEHGCLRCHLLQTPDDSLLGNCNDSGVLGVTTNVLGSIQASEALAFLEKGTNSTHSHSLFLNLSDLSQLKIKNSRNTSCITCEGRGLLSNSDFEVGTEKLLEECVQLLDIRKLHDLDIELFKNSTVPVVLCCERGIRSKKITMRLRAEGHDHFYSLKGGACSL
ncbi:MAG TPA: ThiF family adenylyltransferase [Bacteriovoracaceae bacterium]|nr:ThiF family adenylyltransferase [Bacteriovoracaceae bacterium]